MADTYRRLRPTVHQAPPVVAELQAVFRELPADELLERLQPNPRGMGRPGYNPESLWRSFLAMFYLGLPSVSDLIRLLCDNPYIAAACGFESAGDIPSQSTFSRFYSKLARREARGRVRRIVHGLSSRLHKTLPGFGKTVAIDSTDIKAWSNGGKKGKTGKTSDPDAGWCVKKNTEGNMKYVWGYKAHIIADATYELPIAVDVTAGNVHDSQRATPLLRQAREALVQFWPKHVLADAAYSSDKIRNHIRRFYHDCRPIIDPNPAHKKAVRATDMNPEWRELYSRRVSIERLNGRLKAHRRLNGVRVRGRFKVLVHVLLSVIVLQAQALATQSRASVRSVTRPTCPVAA